MADYDIPVPVDPPGSDPGPSSGPSSDTPDTGGGSIFSKWADPDREGTLGGLVGKILGNDSVVGSSRGDALHDLSALRDQGMSPQQALVKFLQTPAGIKAFHSDPGFMDTAKKFVDTTTAPADTLHNVPTGNQVFATNPNKPTQQIGNNPNDTKIESVAPGNSGYAIKGDSVTPLGVTPPTDAQNFTTLTKIADLDPNRLKDYALQKLAIAGRYTVQSIKNSLGEDTGGFVVLDTHLGTVVPSSKILNPNGEVAPNPMAGALRNVDGRDLSQGGTPAPGQNPDPNAAPAQPGVLTNDKLKNDKRSMFLGSGANAYTLGTAGQIARNIDPNITDERSEQATRQNDYLQQLQFELHNLAQNGGGLGVRSSLIQQASKLGPGPDSWRDPKTSVTSGIQLYDLMQNEIQADKMIVQDTNGYAKEQRVKASERIQQYQAVVRALPTRQEMFDLYNSFPKGNSGAVTLPQMGQSLIDMTKNAVSAATKGLSDLGTRVMGTTPKGEQPAQQPTKPVAAEPPEAVQPDKVTPPTSFSTMTESDIVKVDASKLGPASQKAYRARLDQLIAAKQAGPAQAVPTQQRRVAPTVGGQK